MASKLNFLRFSFDWMRDMYVSRCSLFGLFLIFISFIFFVSFAFYISVFHSVWKTLIYRWVLASQWICSHCNLSKFIRASNRFHTTSYLWYVYFVVCICSTTYIFTVLWPHFAFHSILICSVRAISEIASQFAKLIVLYHAYNLTSCSFVFWTLSLVQWLCGFVNEFPI